MRATILAQSQGTGLKYMWVKYGVRTNLKANRFSTIGKLYYSRKYTLK